MEKKISLNTFKNLTQHEQYDLVFTKGKFINYFLKNETRYALYSLFTFFIQLEYNVKQNKIEELIAFNDGKLLDRYWIITNLNNQ